MIIISHRGYWKHKSEKNTIQAFERSFSLGFGIETDLRDFQGELVISHDIADSKCISLEEFFRLYASFNNDLPLALNIKADGLQQKLKQLLIKFKITNYFVFDMSVPDFKGYLKSGLNCFTRQSEYELSPSFYEPAMGVWLDEFESHWIDESTIIKHHSNNKKICIVSPELHQRDYIKEWAFYKNLEVKENKKLIICTDFPEEARRFFNE